MPESPVVDTIRAEILSDARTFFAEKRDTFYSLKEQAEPPISIRQLHRKVHNFRSLASAFDLEIFANRLGQFEAALTRFQSSNGAGDHNLGSMVDELSKYLSHLSPTAQQVQNTEAEAPVRIVEAHFDDETWELIQGFVDESLPFLERIEALNLEFGEKPLNAENLNEYLRILHTLKGTAASVGLIDLKTLLHAFEDYVLKFKGQQIQLPSEVLSILSAGSDALAEALLQLKEKKVRGFTNDYVQSFFTSAQKNSIDSDPLKERSETIPVDVAKLDDFIEVTGRFTLIGHMMGSSVSSLTSKYPQDSDLRSLRRMIESMEVENAKLQESADSIREVSLESIFRPLKRMVRELGEQLRKQVKFKIEGENTKVSRPSAKLIANCLVHLLRNSLDHGIEAPALRKENGKSEQGTVHCRIVRDEEKIQVHVSDDGKGIDPERIKAKALEKGLKTQSELSGMSESQIFSLIFESGFSTAEQVSDVSGRGVGMDMVRQEILSVRGKINITSKVGQGSTFEIILPLTKSSAIAKMVMIYIGRRTFAIPSSELLQSLDTEEAKPVLIDGHPHHRFNNRFLPLFDLKGTSEVPKQIAVIGDENHLFAIAADEVTKETRLVIRDLDDLSRSMCSFSTTALEGHNKAHLVLDCEAVARILKDKLVLPPEESEPTVPLAVAPAPTPSEPIRPPQPPPQAESNDFLPEIHQLRMEFYSPALEKLSACESRLLEMERDIRANHWQALKQDFHSLKGDSRVLGFENFAKVVHSLESFFSKRKPDSEFFKIALTACDILRRYVETLQSGADAYATELVQLGFQLDATKKK